MNSLNMNTRDFDNPEYFRRSNCDYPTQIYSSIANSLASAFGGSYLELGCGMGYLLDALNKQNIACMGIDISRYCIDKCNHPYTVLGNFLELDKLQTTPADSILAVRTFQTLEVSELMELLVTLKRYGKRLIIFEDKKDVVGRDWFAIYRDAEWYKELCSRYGWRLSRASTSSLKNAHSPLYPLVFEQSVPVRSELSLTDPWLVRTSNISLGAILYTECLPWRRISNTQFINSREEEAETLSLMNEDFIFIGSDCNITDSNLDYALSQFQNPEVGSVSFPAKWPDDSMSYPTDKDWNNYPTIWRSIAYQQVGGNLGLFQDYGWKNIVSDSYLVSKHIPSVPEVLPRISIVTLWDASKDSIKEHYLKALSSIEYPHYLLEVFICKDSGNITYDEIAACGKFSSITFVEPDCDSTWINREGFFPWNGVNHPISIRVAGHYNRILRRVTTDLLLLWESDTIPHSTAFITSLLNDLTTGVSGVSGHYVCRKEKKSLAWDIKTIVPLDYSWATPSTGVTQIDAVPHGMLLLRKLPHVYFSALANDARDLRGPDIVMGRLNMNAGLTFRINWDLTARHYNSDGTFLEPC